MSRLFGRPSIFSLNMNEFFLGKEKLSKRIKFVQWNDGKYGIRESCVKDFPEKLHRHVIGKGTMKDCRIPISSCILTALPSIRCETFLFIIRHRHNQTSPKENQIQVHYKFFNTFLKTFTRLWSSTRNYGMKSLGLDAFCA